MTVSLKLKLSSPKIKNPISTQINITHTQLWASLVVQKVKNLPAMQETWVPSLDGEDPLEKGMASLSSIPAWRIPWTEGPGGLHSICSQRVRHN